MNDNQKKLVRYFQWVFYPIGLLLLIDWVIRFVKGGPVTGSQGFSSFFVYLDFLVLPVVLLLVLFLLLALMQHYFFNRGQSTINRSAPKEDDIILSVTPPNQYVVSILLLVIAAVFSVLLNVFLLTPDQLIGFKNGNEFSFFEKVLFWFFYVLVHFLLLVFISGTIKKQYPVFVAGKSGFCYEPAGISSGWIAWSEVLDIKECTIVTGSYVGPVEMPVLGIKLRNPESLRQAHYSSLFRSILNFGARINNFQTNGAGDILIRPSDLGNQYQQVKELFYEKTRISKY